MPEATLLRSRSPQRRFTRRFLNRRGCYLAPVAVWVNPCLAFFEDLVVCNVDHIAPRTLSCHHACHELRPAHSVRFACGLEAIHELFTVQFPAFQRLPMTV